MIDFGASSLKIIEGKFSKKGLQIKSYLSIPIASGVYKDGEILNIHSLTSLLSEALKENKIKTQDARGIINSTNIITREISLPNVSFQEIESLLKYQVEEYIPINPEDYIVQPLFLDRYFDAGVEKIKLLLVGTPKSMIEAHLALFKNCGLRAEILDFQPNSISKLINYAESINDIQAKHKNIAAIDVGAQNTKVTLIEDGKIILSRIMEFGTKEIMTKSKELGNLDLLSTYDHSLTLQDLNQAKDSELIDMVNSEVDSLINRVEMILRYYRNREEQKNIDLIILYGGFTYLKDIDKKFNNFFNIRTIKMETISNLKFDGPLIQYGSAIGGLIRRGEA